MQLARATSDPINWLLVERRGPFTAHGSYSLETLQLFNDGDGAATLDEGRMTFPRDRGTYELKYQSVPWYVRDGIDPAAATAAATRGVELLVAAVERALPTLGAFAVEPGQRLPRDPDTIELWLRRDSGERGRYLVPIDAAPAALVDAWRATTDMAKIMKANYDQLDPEPAAPGAFTRR